jgi:hypothetical protein
MTGQQLYDDVITPTLGGEEIDIDYALQLVEVARLDFEQRRMWQGLKAKDTSQTVLSGNTPATAFNIPNPVTPSLTTPGFVHYLPDRQGRAVLRLVNSSNPGDVRVVPMIEFEEQDLRQNEDVFFADYPNSKFYLLGNFNATYKIYQYFKADFGAITPTSSWNGFQSRHMAALGLQACARYRLGADYDDLNARNADENYKASEDMFKAMMKWDSELSLQAAQARNFGRSSGYKDGRISGFPGQDLG